jgi:hypothetical protein
MNRHPRSVLTCRSSPLAAMFPASASFRGKGRSPISCGAGRRALMEDGDHWPMKEWSLTPSEMTPRRMSPVPQQQSSESSGNDSQVNAHAPAVNETRSHRLTLTTCRCEIRSLESPAFGLGVLRAGRTGDAGAGCLRRQLLLCGAFNALAITSRFGPVVSVSGEMAPV